MASVLALSAHLQGLREGVERRRLWTSRRGCGRGLCFLRRSHHLGGSVATGGSGLGRPPLTQVFLRKAVPRHRLEPPARRAWQARGQGLVPVPLRPCLAQPGRLWDRPSLRWGARTPHWSCGEPPWLVRACTRLAYAGAQGAGAPLSALWLSAWGRPGSFAELNPNPATSPWSSPVCVRRRLGGCVL